MSEIYRDRTDGANAKRLELLRRRRDELVTMPHAIRRVVVARSARIAAGLAVIVVGTALLATAATPSLAAWITRGLPGIQPAALSTLLGATWIVGLCVYTIARARIEHRFAVAMSRYVLPGEDLDQDIERLDHEHPDEVARQMAHRLEVQSAALPVIAAALVLPATAIYVLHAIEVRGWPVISDFEASLVVHAHVLIGIALAGVVAGVVMTRRAARLPIVAPIAGVLAVLAAGFAVAARHSTVAWLAVAVATIAATMGLVARRLRIERVQIATEDPAAGSELFTLRGLVRRARASLALITRDNVRALARRRSFQIVGLFVAIVAAAVYQHGVHVTTAQAPAPRRHDVIQPGPNAFAPKYRITRAQDGRLQLDFELDGNSPFVMPTLAGLETLPKNWRVETRIELVSTTPGPLTVTAFGLAPRIVDFNAPTTDLAAEVCDDSEQSLAISFQAAQASAGAHDITVYLTPRLGPAHCQ